MKTITLFLTLALITVSANSQTKGSVIFSTAQGKYQKMQTAGTILTAIGGVAVFTGNILYWKVYNNPNQENPDSKAKKYGSLVLGGLGVMAVGIPLWAIGKSNLRHIQIEAQVVRFKGLASASGAGLKISF
jgi:hypothetical protein